MLTGAAALFLIAFFGFVIRHLRDAGRDGGTLPATFQIAAAAVVTSLLFATILEAARAQRIGANADDSTLQAVYAVWLLAFATVNIWILGTGAHRNPSAHHQPQRRRVPTGRARCLITGSSAPHAAQEQEPAGLVSGAEVWLPARCLEWLGFGVPA